MQGDIAWFLLVHHSTRCAHRDLPRETVHPLMRLGHGTTGKQQGDQHQPRKERPEERREG